MPAITYIYALKSPEGEVRYIGKTVNPIGRLRQHIHSAKTSRYHNANWIRSILARGDRPVMDVLYAVPEGEPWQEYEKYFIGAYRAMGFKLTNVHDGGGSDFDTSPEAVSRRVEAARASRQTAEYKEKMGKISSSCWADPEIRQRRLRAMAEARNKPGHLEKRIAAGKEVASRPEVIAKRSAKMKAHYPTSKLKELQGSERMKQIHRETLAKRWAEPGAREALAAAMRSPERQAALQAAITPEIFQRRTEKATETLRKPENRKAASEKAKAQWQDPEFLAKKKAELAARHAPKHTAEHKAIMRDRRNEKKRQKRAEESPEVREARLAERRAQRKTAKLATSPA